MSVDDVSILVQEKPEVHLTAMQEAIPDDQASDHSDEDDDFFLLKGATISTTLTQLDEYLLSPSTETMTVLFFETNPPLPASAACERLFSVAGHIFIPMRARIGDTNFENQLLLKLNRGFVR